MTSREILQIYRINYPIPHQQMRVTLLQNGEIYKYGPPYLPTYQKSFCPNFFFWKKYGWRIPYLPTVWTYVQNFVVFFYWTLSLGEA